MKFRKLLHLGTGFDIATRVAAYEYTLEIIAAGHGAFTPRGEIAEISLWRAVIAQALLDAASDSSTPENLHAREEALRWLNGNDADFRRVCDCAGLDPDYVRRMTKRALFKRKEWRKRIGKTSRKRQSGKQGRKKTASANAATKETARILPFTPAARASGDAR